MASGLDPYHSFRFALKISISVSKLKKCLRELSVCRPGYIVSWFSEWKKSKAG